MANICFGGLNLGVLYRMLCGPSFAEENFKCHFVPPAYKQRKPVYQRLNDRIFFSLYYRLTVTRSRSANGFYRQKKETIVCRKWENELCTVMLLMGHDKLFTILIVIDGTWPHKLLNRSVNQSVILSRRWSTTLTTVQFGLVTYFNQVR